MNHPQESNTEARLRRALSLQADTVEPTMNALDDITRRTESATGATRARGLLLLAAASVVVIGLAAFLTLRDGGDDPVIVADGGGTGTGTTSTTEAPDDAPPATDERTDYGVFISPETFDDPVDAARFFIEDYLASGSRPGIADATYTEFMQGDNNSGEVGVRRGQNGPLTTLFIRKADDGKWAVTGAASDSITLEKPEVLGTISSPHDVAGVSTAFEGTVNITLLADGVADPLVETFAMGGSNGDFDIFVTTLEWDESDLDVPCEPGAACAPHGATLLVFESDASGDGVVSSISMIRVALA